MKETKRKYQLSKCKIKFFSTLNERQKTVIGCIVTAIVVFAFFRTVILWGVVPSESMQPTLDVADIVITNGLAYINDDPQRGDIVIFSGTEGDIKGEILIKRIIGLPGDSLMFVEGSVYINGQLYREDYLDEDMKTHSFMDYEIPEGCYFVLGDNRIDSYDSRYWNNPYITKNDIKGKTIMRIPLSKVRKVVQSVQVKKHPFL